MSTAGLWPTILQSTVGTIVGITVGFYYKRVLRRQSDRVEQLVSAVEHVIGATININPPKGNRPMSRFPNLREYRKGIAATAGVLLIALLSWASVQGNLATVVLPFVPADFHFLVGPVVGGVALIISVVAAKNQQRLEAMIAEDPQVADAVEEALPEVIAQVAPRVERALAPFWADVTPGEGTSTATSIVTLTPIPAPAQ